MGWTPDKEKNPSLVYENWLNDKGEVGRAHSFPVKLAILIPYLMLANNTPTHCDGVSKEIRFLPLCPFSCHRLIMTTDHHRDSIHHYWTPAAW